MILSLLLLLPVVMVTCVFEPPPSPITDQCIDCMVDSISPGKDQLSCTEADNEGCGNYQINFADYAALNSGATHAEFLTCAFDNADTCAIELVRTVIEANADECNSKLGGHSPDRTFADLTCYEYGDIWRRGDTQVCEANAPLEYGEQSMAYNCPGSVPRPVSRYNPTLCETSWEVYGECIMNDQACSGGIFTDGLCRHPSNTGQIQSKSSAIHRSCCVDHLIG